MQFPASRAAHPRSPRRGLAAGGRGRRTRAVRDEAEAGPSAAHLPRPASSRSPHRHPQIHRVLCAAKATGERPHPSYGGAADGTAHSSRGTPDGPGSSSLSSGLCLLEPSGLGLRVTEHASVIYSPSTHGSRQLPARVGQALPTTELMRAAPATTTPCPSPLTPASPQWLPVWHLSSVPAPPEQTAGDWCSLQRGTSDWAAGWVVGCDRAPAATPGLDLWGRERRAAVPLLSRARENTFLIETHLYIYIYMCVCI